MKREIRIFMLATCAVMLGCQSLGRDPLFRLTLHVVDDEGKPVSDAYARVGADRRPKAGESEGKGIFVEGLTDARGSYTGELEAWDASEAGYRVWKDGHYPVWLPYRAKSPVRGKWQPWNPTIKVVLKRIKNPVPMYAKKLALSLPALDEPVGYDFLMGDWVIPHGQGKVSDVTFVGKSSREGDRKFDWQLQIAFTNRGDGIQRFAPDPESAVFRSAYEAPAEGYLSEWKLRRWRNGPAEAEQTTFDRKAGYYFRVRTELDSNGMVMKALYGKIYGDFFDMVYYLNPDGTRNMEYDPKRNLLKPPTNRDRSYYEVGS